MKSTISVRIAAAIIALATATFLFAPAVFAHASVTSVAWDNATNPTRLVGQTGSDPISSAPGEFALKVFNSSGAQVDNKDARVSPTFTEISVGVPANLPSGVYRVEWTVTAEDGDTESGTIAIQLTRATTSNAPAPAPVITAATDSHATVGDHFADSHTHAAVPTEKFTMELQLTGDKEVPPVKSAASAFARITVDPKTNELTYSITVSGVAPGAVTGLHIHSGGPAENGPHVFDIINAPFTTISGKTTLSGSAINDLYNGTLYLRLHTIAFPSGAARAQLIVPAAHDDHATPATTTTVRPPSTGDAGLAATGADCSLPVAALAAIAFAVIATASARRFARQRA